VPDGAPLRSLRQLGWPLARQDVLHLQEHFLSQGAGQITQVWAWALAQAAGRRPQGGTRPACPAGALRALPEPRRALRCAAAGGSRRCR
jgi:hypothetical protein